MKLKEYGKYKKDEMQAEASTDIKDTSYHSNFSDFGESFRDYSDHRGTGLGAVEKNTYRHWESPEKQAENQKEIRHYDEKKSAVDQAALRTQKSVLDAQRERINYDNYQRISKDVGSNKTEIYSEANFRALTPNDERRARIIGMRDMKEGKIQIRDSDDIDSLKHTSTHETLHDLSFQNKEHNVDTFSTDEGDLISVSETRYTSGIHIYENKEYNKNGETKLVEEKQLNRYLNEGITEKNTITEMLKRGENPPINSYTQEVNWAISLENKVGKNILDDAYYGGNIDQLKEKVDSMSNCTDTWEDLNHNIDRYHYELDPIAKMEYKRNVDTILDELHDREKELKKVR